MSIIGKTAVCMLAILSMAVSAFAAYTVEPTEVKNGHMGDLKTIEKVYILSSGESPDFIPKDKFTQDGIEYAFEELVAEDNSLEESREHAEPISIHTSTSNAKKVMSQFEPTMDITTEDGFEGTLDIDYTSLDISPAGYGKQSYTINESRSYPNLMDADTSLVPKTINKDGATLSLTNISWQSAANNNIDGQEVAVRYTANATYSGTGTKSYVKGYTATVVYKGEIKKIVNDTITYTAVFAEVPQLVDMEEAPKGHFASYWWAYLTGLLALGGGGYGAYRLIRKRKAGY